LITFFIPIKGTASFILTVLKNAGWSDVWLIMTDKYGRTRNKATYNPFFYWFLERFPILEKLFLFVT